MRPLLFLITFLTIGVNTFAHDHDLATFTIYKKLNVWLLKIDFASSEMHAHFHQQGLSEQEEKEQIITYLKEHIHLVADDSLAVNLVQGGIKTDGHSTEVIFVLEHFSEDWKSFDCTVGCFHENSSQSNLLRINFEDESYKAFLNAENDFHKKFTRVTIE